MHYNLSESQIAILKEFYLDIHKFECTYTNCTYTFDILGEMLTERYFSTLVPSFFLKMGVMVALFKCDGKFEKRIIEVIVNKVGISI